MKKQIIFGFSLVILIYLFLLRIVFGTQEYFSKDKHSYYYSIHSPVGVFNSINFEKYSTSNGFGEEDYVSEVIKVSKRFSHEKFSLENKGFPRDEEVDNITLTKGNASLKIDRATYFKEYESLFLKADKILKETRARFEKRIAKQMASVTNF